MSLSTSKTNLWDSLVDNLNKSAKSSQSIGSYLTVCGRKGSGQSTIVRRMTRNTIETPMPTIGLEYECIRDPHNTKRVAHFYDIGGDEKMSDLLALSITPATVELSSVLICLDASKPGTIYRTAVTWLDAVARRVERCLTELEEGGPETSSVARRIRERALQTWEGCAWLDQPVAMGARSSAGIEFSKLTLREHLNRCPIPVVLVLTKWDRFARKATEPEHIKVLVKALRNLAALRGVGLVTSSIQGGVNDEHMQKLHHLVKALVLPTKQVAAKGFAQSVAQAKPKRRRVVGADSDSDASSDSETESEASDNEASSSAARSPDEIVREMTAKLCEDRLIALRGFSRTFHCDDGKKGLFILPGAEKDPKLVPEAERLAQVEALFGDGSKEADQAASKAAQQKAVADSFREDAVDALVAQRSTDLVSAIADMNRQFR